MDRRQFFKKAFKAGYKKALQESAYASGGWHANAGAAIRAGELSRAAAEKYGMPQGGELKTIDIPVHVEYGLRVRKAARRNKRYLMIRLASRGMWIGGINDKWPGHYQQERNEYFYDPELGQLREDEEQDILKCNNRGYPNFLIQPVYNYMIKNDLHENMYNPNYRLSRVLAKYAVMVINNILEEVGNSKGEADFTIQVPYRVGRDNVYSKIFWVDEKDFSKFANQI